MIVTEWLTSHTKSRLSVIYRRSTAFKKAYQTLPNHIQAKVKKAFSLFQLNPNHPSLGVKKLKGKENIWEGRIDQFYF